jgi:hypothetical protein
VGKKHNVLLHSTQNDRENTTNLQVIKNGSRANVNNMKITKDSAWYTDNKRNSD